MSEPVTMSEPSTTCISGVDGTPEPMPEPSTACIPGVDGTPEPMPETSTSCIAGVDEAAVSPTISAENIAVENCAITEDALLTLIHENQYIQKCSSNKKKDVNSLSSLITRELSQSDCIKLGNGVEKFFIDFIMKYTSFTNIKGQNKKGEKEKDHLFCDEERKIIYYSELKSNLNLDTEKSKSTYFKCLGIVEDLKNEYPGYTIRWCLLGLRQLTYDDMPSIIQKKYSTVKDNLFGINQYLTMLNIDLRFNIETYTSLLNNIANAMFE
jgi:hypothetical protein